jgi:prolyl-tRNA synthetase
MRLSRLLLSTLRDTPAEAEVVSHQLLLRAGYIRRVASGIYAWLPLMWRVIDNISAIVRDEMNKAYAQELLLPMLQPADLWEASGRWEVYGKELMRLKDRHGRWNCLAPTGEEVVTSLVANEVKSYRQLPVNVYQIANKYRDEIRPRFGLLRGREFLMKDAYSFHTSQACLEAEYGRMAEAYTAIFNRCGLDTKMVRSDSGAIGGAVSHEFMVLTGNQTEAQQSGENDVVYCNASGYAANSEKAEATPRVAVMEGTSVFAHYGASATRVATPNTPDIERLQAVLNCQAGHICKALAYTVNESFLAVVLIRADYQAEETKVKNALGATQLRLATAEELATHLGAEKGYVGFYQSLCAGTQPLPKGVKVLIDETASALKHFVMADNEAGYHWVNASWGYDATALADTLTVGDFRTVQAGDFDLESGQPVEVTRGIEVGNIFQLGTKYSASMQATYMAEDGTEQPFVMGCYGIGVSRVAAAAIEQHHDANGIVWPVALAPYKVIVIPANVKDEHQAGLAVGLYESLQASLGDDVVLDDRDERAGVKFKDADLVGYPLRVTVGKLAVEGKVEVKWRNQPEPLVVEASGLVGWVKEALAG